MSKVSIIIPVYNTEKYLKECLDSVVNQTLRDIEIILIDNASTDKSLQILKEYAENDKRIIIIENTINQNASYARNQGLEIAKGEFLSFLDSDDWFELDMLEIVYNTCKENGTDIGIFSSEIFDSNIRKTINEIRLPYFFRSKFNIANINTFECKKWLFNMFIPAAWNKLFKTEYIKKFNLKFQEITAANDLAFVMQALFFSNNFSYLDKSFVHYRQNHSNCISEYRNKNVIYCYEAFEFAKSKLENSDKFIYFCDSFFRFLIENLHYSLKNTTKEDYEKVKKKLLENTSLFETRDGKDKSSFNKFNNFFYKNICDLDYDSFIQEDCSKAFYLFNYLNAIDFLQSNIGKNIALWGAGKNGRAFLSVFGEKIEIRYIIDKDIKKQGYYIDKIKINNFDDIKDKIDTIIVTNESFYEEILEQVKEYNADIKVLDLDTYLRFEIFSK